MKVYKHQNISDLELYYGDLLTKIDQYSDIKDHLEALVARMWEGVQSGKEVIFKQISNYHWKHLGKSAKELSAGNLNEEDCKQAIANEYGFRRWTEVTHLRSPYNSNFEQTVDALLAGDLSEIQKRLSIAPSLLNTKSQYGHKATLLHYAASNGVEFWRQKVPLNLPEIVAYLIEQGANRKAKMKVYGGEYTAAELLLSSAHPIEAGIITALRRQFES